MPHAALTREVFILTNDTNDVSLAVVILALCVVVTRFLVTAAVGVDSQGRIEASLAGF